MRYFCRIFCIFKGEIMQLWHVLLHDHFENHFNPYWRISGVWARPIYGKLIQTKLIGTYSVLFKFGVWARLISGKLIQNRAKSRTIIFDKFRGVTQTVLFGLFEIVEFSFRTIWNQIFLKQWIVKTMGTNISKKINL